MEENYSRKLLRGLGQRGKRRGGGCAVGGFVGRGGNTCEVRETFGSSLWAV